MWIAWNKTNKCFLKHPRGSLSFDMTSEHWTQDIDQAYGWHYKQDALNACDYRVQRREDVKKELNIK